MIRLWRPEADPITLDSQVVLSTQPWAQYEIVLRGSYVELAAATPVLDLAQAGGLGVNHTLRRWKRWSRHRLPFTVARGLIHVEDGTLVLVARWRRVRPVKVYR